MAYSLGRAAHILSVATAVLFAVCVGYRHVIIGKLLYRDMIQQVADICRDAADRYKCNALQAGGRWVGSHRGPYNSDKYLYWQPPGCLLHKYNARDIETCLQCKRLLFVGDSTIRQVYWATARKLDRERAAEMSLSASKHSNLKFEQGCVQIEFLWDPFLNSTTLREEVRRYHLRTNASDSTRVVAMLVGSGLWHAKDLGPSFLDTFKQNIDQASTSLPRNARDGNGVLLPPSLREGTHDLVIFAPVPLPIQSELDPTRAATLTPENMQAMNDYLRSAVKQANVEVLWSYSLMTWQRPSAHEGNGIHVVENVAERQADILLNMRCNSEPSLQQYPFDKTCCNVQPFVTPEQLLLILVAAITTFYALYGLTKQQIKDESGLSMISTNQTIKAAGILAMAILYCFVADRTLIFDRFQKVPNQQTFLQLAALILLGGLFTVRRSDKRSANIPAKPTRTTSDQTFLSRDQTDEWKGWMQFVILIYHYTGMSSVLWVYQIVRLMVASYLFMTGFGHTVYFLKTNNFSLKRVATVLIHLNLLSCLLAYLMRTDYNFYYFPALSSFWFLVVYLTIRIRHQPNVVPRMLVLKICVSAILVRILILTPGVMELVFQLLQKTCNIEVNVHEFRFRLSLDGYIVYAGMFAASLYLQLNGGLPCSTTCLATQIKRIPTVVHVLTVLASMAALPAYLVIIRRCPDKYDYNWWHPMISPLPILAIVVLRNATQTLRDYHSRLFAWLGRFSLETFILQYHIWLAADTKALLSLGLWSRDRVGTELSDRIGLCCEFILVTALFLWTSWAVSHATNVLTLFIVEGRRTSGASGLLTSIRWRQPSGTAGDVQASTLSAGLARHRLGLPEQGYGEKEDTKATIPPKHEDMTTGKSSSLALRLMILLLLMWIGNWVSHRLQKARFQWSETNFSQVNS